jgi:WD40 repeat protein
MLQRCIFIFRIHYKIEASFMKTVLSFFALLAAAALCFSNMFAQADMQVHLPEGAKARIGKGGVYELAYSPDSTRLAVASTIGIWIYDARTGEVLRLLTGHTDSVRCVAFSPDGSTLVSGSSDRTIRLWDADTGEPTATLTGHTATVYSVAFSPDGQTLASGGSDEFIKFWDVRTGELLQTFAGHAGRIDRVVYAPDGETLASYGADRRIHLWDAKTGEFVMALDPEFEDAGLELDRIYAIAYSPDSQSLASGNSDGRIRFWDTRTGELKSTLIAHARDVTAVTFSPDGQRLAGAVSLEDSSTIQFWNVATGERLKSFVGPTSGGHTDRITALAFSKDGGMFASSSDDETIRFWHPTTETPLRTITGHNRERIFHVMYASHGRILACLREENIQLWEPHTGRRIKTVDFKERIFSTAYSPDNVTFACETAGGNVWLLDANTGESNETPLIGHTEGISSLDFNRDGSILASGSYDRTIRLWNVDTGDLRKTLEGHTDGVQHVAFSPTGLILASASDDGTIQLWDIKTGDVIKILEGHADWVGHVAFSPTGLILASTGGDGTIRLWDIKTGEPLKTITPASRASFIVYSPDGNTLASTDRKVIHLWNAHSGELLRTLTGHIGYIYSIAFSPDGRTLTSGSRDGTMLLWKVVP